MPPVPRAPGDQAGESRQQFYGVFGCGGEVCGRGGGGDRWVREGVRGGGREGVREGVSEVRAVAEGVLMRGRRKEETVMLINRIVCEIWTHY